MKYGAQSCSIFYLSFFPSRQPALPLRQGEYPQGEGVDYSWVGVGIYLAFYMLFSIYLIHPLPTSWYSPCLRGRKW